MNHPTPMQFLTPREREVLLLLAEAKSVKQVAADLGIAWKTVEAHKANLMKKLALHNRAELVRYALENGLIEG